MNSRWYGGFLFALAILVVGLLYVFDYPEAEREEADLYPEKVDVVEEDLSPLVEELDVAPAPVASPKRSAFWELDPGDSVDDLKNPRLLRHYGSDTRTGKEDLEAVAAVLQRFWMLFKDPDLLVVGSNEDVLKSLLGGNPEGIAFISPENEFIDSKGRLLDRWGTPLFFHAESMRQIEIRSSGPDRDRFTEDDIVTRASTAVRLRE